MQGLPTCMAHMGRTAFPATLSGVYNVAMLSGLTTPVQQADFRILTQYWPEVAVPTRPVLFDERTLHVLG